MIILHVSYSVCVVLMVMREKKCELAIDLLLICSTLEQKPVGQRQRCPVGKSTLEMNCLQRSRPLVVDTLRTACYDGQQGALQPTVDFPQTQCGQTDFEFPSIAIV